jgi:hypothetical protein
MRIHPGILGQEKARLCNEQLRELGILGTGGYRRLGTLRYVHCELRRSRSAQVRKLDVLFENVGMLITPQ